MQQPPNNQPPQTRPIQWLDVRYQGALVYRVNAADPTHIQFPFRFHGEKELLESLTTTLAVTGSKAV